MAANGRRPPLDDDLLTLLVALVAGLVAALGPAAPTGNDVVDALLLGVGTAAIVLVGALAPWWAAVVAAAAATAVAGDWLLVAWGLAALAGALWLGATTRDRRVLTAATFAVSFNVLGRAAIDAPLGVTALVTWAVAVLVFVTGIRRRATWVRRLAWGGVGACLLFAVVASAGFAYEAATARHALGSGMATAELGVAALENGDFDGAIERFREARDNLEQANARLDTPWARAAALVPVTAVYQRAVSDMSHVGADGAGVVIDALDQIDLAELQPRDGKFDLAALAALAAPLTEVRDALLEVQDTAARVRSPWLVNRATYELDDFDESVDEHLPSLEQALRAIELAPTLLGADGERTYLLLFTTPAESRALGGFVGSYAELTVDDGQLSLGRFGRAQDLDQAVVAAGARVEGHEEFRAAFGHLGFDRDGEGLVGDAAFRNLALTPNFPWIGEIASDLYTQTTGRPIDGVIVMDPEVVATLLRYTGTVHLTTLDTDVTPDNALQFLLRDQYVLGASDAEERADGLAEAASLAFLGLLGGALPEPIQLARDLGPLTSERRLLVWSAHPEEQALFEDVGIDGGMPALDGADGWSFSVANTGGNKIDSYLERRAGYTATTDPATGATSGEVRIELTNTAPAEGLPAYVIGNRVGKPLGTASLLVTLYSALDLDGVTVDGAPVGVAAGTEAGWKTYRFAVDIPAGATTSIIADVSGTVTDPTRVVTWTQPMATDLQGF